MQLIIHAIHILISPQVMHTSLCQDLSTFITTRDDGSGGDSHNTDYDVMIIMANA